MLFSLNYCNYLCFRTVIISRSPDSPTTRSKERGLAAGEMYPNASKIRKCAQKITQRCVIFAVKVCLLEENSLAHLVREQKEEHTGRHTTYSADDRTNPKVDRPRMPPP